jgi:aspartyl/asparaginyl beta-hydroxylase (cupin superfamily)
VTRDFVVFDDSKTHSAFNNTDSEERVVLLLDLMRPPGVPKGVSEAQHTEELDQLIDEYNSTG